MLYESIQTDQLIDSNIANDKIGHSKLVLIVHRDQYKWTGHLGYVYELTPVHAYVHIPAFAIKGYSCGTRCYALGLAFPAAHLAPDD